MLPSVAETNEQLLARWRRTQSEVHGYVGQQLDPVDRQTLNELRRQLTEAEAELARRGLSTTGGTRTGTWQPLPLHGAPPKVEKRRGDFTWEPSSEVETDWGLLSAARAFDEPDDERTAWILERRPELRGEWRREFARSILDLPARTPTTRRRAAPFVPDLCDGLTQDQRTFVEQLALGPHTAKQLLTGASEASAAALAQLRLPRPYPLVAEDGDLLRLTPLANELVEVDSRGARVHGGLFPNLLVNGVADPFSFPIRDLSEVLAAARLLWASPDTALASLEARARQRPERFEQWWTSAEFDPYSPTATELRATVVPRWAPGRLEFHFLHADDAAVANETLADAEARGELVPGISHALDDARLVVTLPEGNFGLGVVRRLARDCVLETDWTLETLAADAGVVRTRTLDELLRVFLSRTRQVVGRRLRRQFVVREPRLEAVEGLLRIADDERLAALVDATESRAEGIWALTHLGTHDLATHPRLGRFSVDADPFSEAQAMAIVDTKGLHRRRAFLELEHQALLEAHRGRPGWVTRQMVDDAMLAEFDRIAALGRDSRA